MPDLRNAIAFAALCVVCLAGSFAAGCKELRKEGRQASAPAEVEQPMAVPAP